VKVKINRQTPPGKRCIIDNPAILLAKSNLEKHPAVLATVVKTVGATPAKTGAQLVLLPNGSTAGTVDRGKSESAVIADAQAALSDGQPCLKHSSLDRSSLV
jgi:xanthine/CO dehydrogenase XdhC/CoxF family maturation factor